MDKAKGVLKGGWHPAGDPKIHRDSWKSDLKGIATGKTPEKKQLEASRNHQAVPLASLKDPDNFGPPPKHNDALPGGSGTPTSPARPRPPPPGGLGGPVPAPRRRQEEQEAEEEKVNAPPVPYRTDTTGLSTNNLPKPPARRVVNDMAPAPAPPPRNSSPTSPALPVRSQPQLQQQQQPTAPPRARPQPSLPPRMNEHPDEYTPPPPPTYNEATQPVQRDPALLNTAAVNRLGQAGVSVPGFGIGGDADRSSTQGPSSPQGHAGQLSELQQRFARMNPGAESQPSSPATSSASSAVTTIAAAAAHKKPPPPPPPKKANLTDGSGSRPGTADGANAPPPLPLSSKPPPR